MRGLWIEAGEVHYREDLPEPTPAVGEALINTRLAGICGTDLQLLDGYADFRGIPGHEFVGVVEEGPAEWVGRRVVGEINLPCGRCDMCERDAPTQCRDRRALGIHGHPGCFAEFFTLPAANLHAVPEGVPDEAAVFTEPLAAAFRILEQVDISPTDRVLVIGPGRLGQLVARVLAETGCRLTAAGRTPAKLQLLEAVGIHTVALDDIATGSFDVAVDCTGHPDGFAIARDALRPRGTLVLKSSYVGPLQVDAVSWMVDEISVVGSRCGPFEPALEWVGTRGESVADLVSHVDSLRDGAAALRRAEASMKVLLRTM